MRKSRFTEEQIIARSRSKRAGSTSSAASWRQRAHVLPLAQQVRRHGGERCAQAEGARGRESAAEAHRRRPDSRQPDAESDQHKKMVSPPHAARLRVTSRRTSESASGARAASSICRERRVGTAASGWRTRSCARISASSPPSVRATATGCCTAAAPQGLGHQPQAGLPPLSRGGAGGAPPRPQAHRRARRQQLDADETRTNEAWSMDFVSDAPRTAASSAPSTSSTTSPASAWPSRWTPRSAGSAWSGSSSAGRAARVPERIVMDNGPEFTSKALDAWAHANGVKLHFIRPGKPTENAYVESFNGRFREECLNENWFVNLVEARRGSRSGEGTTTKRGHTARWAISRPWSISNS